MFANSYLSVIKYIISVYPAKIITQVLFVAILFSFFGYDIYLYYFCSTIPISLLELLLFAKCAYSDSSQAYNGINCNLLWGTLLLQTMNRRSSQYTLPELLLLALISPFSITPFSTYQKILFSRSIGNGSLSPVSPKMPAIEKEGRGIRFYKVASF